MTMLEELPDAEELRVALLDERLADLLTETDPDELLIVAEDEIELEAATDDEELIVEDMLLEEEVVLKTEEVLLAETLPDELILIELDVVVVDDALVPRILCQGTNSPTYGKQNLLVGTLDEEVVIDDDEVVVVNTTVEDAELEVEVVLETTDEVTGAYGAKMPLIAS